MSIIVLTVGDWSNDGHGRSADVTIRCSHNVNDLEDAYKKGCKILGFDVEDEIARNYEDNILHKHHFEAFKRHGLEWNWDGDDGEEIYLDANAYAELWLFAAKLGNKDLTYEVMSPDGINIGGYGIFR